MSLTEAMEHVKLVLRSMRSDFLLFKKGERNVSCVAKHHVLMEMLLEKLGQHNLCLRVTCLYQEDALPVFVFDLDWC